MKPEGLGEIGRQCRPKILRGLKPVKVALINKIVNNKSV